MRKHLLCVFVGLMVAGVVNHPVAAQGVKEAAAAARPATALARSETDWPWWRGPHVDGAALGSPRIPQSWSATENVLWKAEIPGEGHSSPIVLGQRVYLTTAVEQDQVQSLVCLDFTTGRTIWNTPLHRGQFAKMHGDNSQASGTPATNGQLIFTLFGNKDGVWLSAVNLEGKVAWSVNTGPYPSEHGFGTSVCLAGNLVFVAGEALHTGFVGAFDAASGKEVWRKPREPDAQHANYATPIVANIAGKPQLIQAGWHLVSAYEPATGELLWEIPGPADVNSNTVAVQDPYVIVSGGYPQKKILCVKADEPEGAKGRKVIWESTRNVSWVPTPLIHDQRVLLLSDSGVLSDLNLLTGEAIWTQRLGGQAYSSPIRVGDQFVAVTRNGVATVFKSTDKFEKISENDLGDGGGNATPVVVGNRMLIRCDHTLFCVGETGIPVTNP